MGKYTPKNLFGENMNILKRITTAGSILAALAFYACGSDSDSSVNSAPETLSSASSDITDSSNVANISSSNENYSSSNEDSSATESSSSVVSYTKLAWEFMNPNIDYIEFTDERDGQVYRAVVIGEQTWMAQNLSYNQYEVYAYNNCPRASVPDSCGKYGILYSYQDRKDVCPNGWHLPSSDEWKALFSFVGSSTEVYKKLRTTTGWTTKDSDEEDKNGTDDFGFSAYPSGYKLYTSVTAFGEEASFWTSSMGGVGPMIVESKYSYFRTDQITTQSYDSFAIRCIKDSAETGTSDE